MAVGRKKRFENRLTLPLPEAMVERIDAVLTEGEPRLDLIRGAIEREVERREKASTKRVAVRSAACDVALPGSTEPTETNPP